MATPMTRGACSVCGGSYAVTPRGVIFSHRAEGGRRCPGMGQPPAGDAHDDRELVHLRTFEKAVRAALTTLDATRQDGG